MHVLDLGMHAKQALTAPRIPHPWPPDQTSAAPIALSADPRKRLEATDHPLVDAESPWGAAAAIVVVPDAAEADGFSAEGASDDRRPAGAAVGE